MQDRQIERLLPQNPVRRPHSSVLILLQSSGSGRSRLIEELDKSTSMRGNPPAFVLSLCMRTRSIRQGYPPGDHKVAGFLQMVSFSRVASVNRLKALLVSILHTACVLLRHSEWDGEDVENRHSVATVSDSLHENASLDEIAFPRETPRPEEDYTRFAQDKPLLSNSITRWTKVAWRGGSVLVLGDLSTRISW